MESEFGWQEKLTLTVPGSSEFLGVARVAKNPRIYNLIMADRSTVTAYWRREDAAVARRALDFEGIDAEVEEKSVAKVRVENVDALRAGDVLNRSCDHLDEVGEPDEELGDPGVCPECGSPDIASSMRGRLFAALVAVAVAVSVAVGRTELAFLGLCVAGVFLLIAQRWRCAECGCRWD